MEELENLELTREDLEELSAEELVDIKIELEDLEMDIDEILQENSDEE